MFSPVCPVSPEGHCNISAPPPCLHIFRCLSPWQKYGCSPAFLLHPIPLWKNPYRTAQSQMGNSLSPPLPESSRNNGIPRKYLPYNPHNPRTYESPPWKGNPPAQPQKYPPVSRKGSHPRKAHPPWQARLPCLPASPSALKKCCHSP